jgi:hypothetical protein
MSNCQIYGTSVIAGENTTKIIKFTPTKNLIANTYIMISMPMWFSSISNVPGSLTCSGISVSYIINLEY